MKKKDLKEGMGYREFMDAAYAGATGYDYGYKNPYWGFGEGPETYEPSIEDMLSHINAISQAALAKYETLDSKQKEHVYIKRQLEKAKGHLREAYLRMMDLNRPAR